MRGTLGGHVWHRVRPRIIPAHAGNSRAILASQGAASDHPRACGELALRLGVCQYGLGSSPRMRGTPGKFVRCRGVHRIIPAHAGNSCPTIPCTSARTDHPRACGELARCWIESSRVFGSSPRMRGTRDPVDACAFPLRIIPAHAGNSRIPPDRVTFRADHPRACGELWVSLGQAPTESGSSPRMRGTRLTTKPRRASSRIIPAHAGNSTGTPSRRTRIADHPRACGELRVYVREAWGIGGSSPRMRGTLQTLEQPRDRRRIIPAHAGNSGRCARACRRRADHPRACGELGLLATL